MKPISLRKQKFVDAMLKSPNATEAAKAAGYAEKTAASAGSRLMKDPDVQAALAARAEKVAEDAEVDAAWVLRRLKLEAVGCGEGGPRIKALELIGKHLGLFADHLRLSDKNGEALEFIVKGPG